MSTEKKSPALTAIVLVVLLAATALVLAGTSCRTVAPIVDDATHIALDCGKPAIRNIASHILDDVASALVTADYAGGIRGIVAGLIKGVADAERQRALDEAWEAAACAVNEVHQRVNTSLAFGYMDAATTDRQKMIQAHASQWLAGHTQ